MECSDFIRLDNRDVWFPLRTKYTRYSPDGSPQTVDVYRVFAPEQVAFNLDLDDDAFRIAFKRGTRLGDRRPNRPTGVRYFADGLQEDLFVLPSELAALVDAGDWRIVGGRAGTSPVGGRAGASPVGGRTGTNPAGWFAGALLGCAIAFAAAIVLTRGARRRARH
jgi:hypothetical protein